MKKLAAIIATILCMTACDPLDTGDPPVMNNFSANAIGESQIQLTWQASDVSDDLIATEDLQYGIWVGKTEDGELDLTTTPSFTTDEGALSYTLVGLEPATEYHVLVRVADRSNVYSENETTQTVTTLAVGAGTFGPAVKVNITDSPSRIIAGRAGSAADSVGIILSDRINFYSYSNGTLVAQTNQSVTIANLRDAHLVPVNSTGNDHLFALSDGGLTYYTNDTGFTASAMSFEGVPVEGTFTYRLNNNVLDIFSYVAEGGLAHIYREAEEPTDTVPFEGFTYTTGSTNPLFTMAKLNNDDDYDIVYFTDDNRIFTAQANDDSLTDFATAVEVDALTSDDLGEGNYLGYLFVEDGDGDGNADIYVFVRNEGSDETRLISYAGNGDGTFEEGKTADYGFHFYSNPLFLDAGGDGKNDLLVSQTSSNNVAVYFAPSSTFSGSPTYFGIDGAPTMAISANIDATNGPDLVVFDATALTLNVLYSSANN